MTDPDVEVLEKPVKTTFDRVHDDECHDCVFSVRKPEEAAMAPWDRLYGCTYRGRILNEISSAIRKLQMATVSICSSGWAPDLGTLELLSRGQVYASNAGRMVGDMRCDGYMEPEIMCPYRKRKENDDEVPKGQQVQEGLGTGDA